MKTMLIILVFIHGLLHLLGFTIAFNITKLSEVAISVSRFSGILWLVAGLLLINSVLFYINDKDWWWITAGVALLLSQYLIILNWEEAKYGTLINAIILVIILLSVATAQFKDQYHKDVQEQLNKNANHNSKILTEQDIELLPNAIKIYLQYCGVIGKPKVNHFKVRFSGQLRKDTKTAWMPVTSSQYNFVDSTSRFFFMNAMMKGMPVAGYHRFCNGKAIMDIRLLSLFKVQYKAGKEMDEAETVTFFNDMCCLAPATLIDKRIKWLDSDSHNVKASFTSNVITITATLYFSDDGKMTNFESNDRFAIAADNSFKKAQWSTPIRGYKIINGINLPAIAETIWHFPKEDLCYGSFTITNVEYNPTYLDTK
jgi:hypothetical protein